MTQTMGQIIKNLRKEHGFTQDDLAEKLNISPQAVSRWENEISMPDISQIIPIAALFGVSTDVLFGLNPAGAYAAIEELYKITNSPDIDTDRCIALWSDLLKIYPRNNVIRCELAKFYTWRKNSGDYSIATELYEKILDESTDQSLRLKAIDPLCLCYKRMGDTKNAIRIAKLCGSEYISEDHLLADIDGYENEMK